MALQDKSILTLFSIGYVTTNKARDSRKIQCLPVESASATDGETTHNPLQDILKGVDKDGNAYEVKGTQTRDIECEWMPTEDNRATPPDMRRGELVEIYRVGKTSQYYWRCMGFRNNLRNLEHVVWMFAASPDAGGAGGTFEKCYSLTFSPMDGHITVQTTKANKESFAYTFQINTKDSLVGMTDDVGNYWELNSKESRHRFKNVDESHVTIEKQWIEMEASQHIQLKVGSTVLKLTPEMIDGISQIINMHGKATMLLKSPAMTIESTVVTAKVGKWAWVTG